MENVIVNNVDITNLVTSFESFDEMDKDMVIGSAISTQIKLKLKNKDDQLKQLLDYPFLIGNKRYIVYEKPEKWTKTISVTLYDYMILANVAYVTMLEYPTTVSKQLDEMAIMTEVEIDKSTLSNELLNKTIGWYDSEMIIRNYLGFIAQCDGKNAFIENDKVVFKEIAKTTHVTDFCSDYELNELITFSRVRYDNGLTEPLQKGDDASHTLYLSSNNLYVDETDIDRIYSLYNGLSFYSFKKFKTKLDSLNLTDIITYNDITVMPLSIKKTVYGGEARNALELTGDIVIKNADSVIIKQNLAVRIKKIQTTIDQVNQTLEIVAVKQENQQKELVKFELTIDGIKQTVSKTQEALLGVTNYFKELESIKPIIEEESTNGYEYINKRLKLLVVEQGIFEFYKIDNFINGFSKEKTYSTSIDVYIESEDETLEVPIVISCGGKATDFVLNNKKQRIVLEDFSFNEFETYIFNVSQGGIIIAIENMQLVLGGEYRESSKGLQEMSTEIIQSNQNIEFVKKGLEEIQSDLDGYVEKTYLEEFVRFDGAKITLGTSKSSFSTVITNSELAFYDGSTKVAFISNNAMNIFDAVIENSLTIGKFIFKPRSNGNLSLMKVGDS